MRAMRTYLSVFQVRDEIEQLMDDDSDMAEMYLTEKKIRMADFSLLENKPTPYFNFSNGVVGGSMSAPVSPVGSPVNDQRTSLMDKRLEKSYSLARSKHDSTVSSRTEEDRVEELEMLLEAYFVVIDGTLNKLTSVFIHSSHLLEKCDYVSSSSKTSLKIEYFNFFNVNFLT